MTASLGTLARLYRYPVKSLAAEPLDRATLDASGLAGDRGRALFVASSGNARYGKPYRGKENELLHTVRDDSEARRLARSRDVDVALRDDGPFFDDAPVSIVFDTWVRKLEDLVHESLDPLRFRANLYVEAAAGFSASEAELVGRTFAIGTTALRCTATIKRCVTITYDIPTGRPDPNIGRVVATELDNVMGVYCDIVRPGSLALGDAVTLA